MLSLLLIGNSLVFTAVDPPTYPTVWRSRYQFDGVAYESIVIGLFSIITGKRCSPPRPFHRGGEQDAVYVGWSRDGFHFQRSPIRSSAFLPMGTLLHSWNFRAFKPDLAAAAAAAAAEVAVLMTV